MNVLVCVKRVPAPGAKIVLTADGQAIDTRHLGFTISPHEECAVEEAVRITEQHGGEVTVLTLGPAEAVEQLQYAMAMGAHHGAIVEIDGVDWDPQATAAALAAAVAELQADGAAFDLVLFGNESADAANHQVGIRLAYRLGLPVVTGGKALEIADGAVTIHRGVADGLEVYELPLPCAVGVKEGINLPRYPTVMGRLRAKKAEVRRVASEPDVGGLELVGLRHPLQVETETVVLGRGPEAAPAVVDVLEELGVL